MIDARLKEWATPQQAKYIDAVNDNEGNQRAAARALGIHRKMIFKGIKAVQSKAARSGYSPEHDMVHTVPNLYKVRGVSTNYGADGAIKQQWVKSQLDEKKWLQVVEQIAASMGADLPKYPRIKAPNRQLKSELCNVYTLTDSHVGMLAWGEETGADWDLSIAEHCLVGCFEQMIINSPPAEVAIVNQLGDFLHYDGMIAQTPLHGNPLDADGRFSKMVDVAVRVLRKVIDLSLENHKQVHVVMAEGNHDIASSVWLRKIFSMLYENNPRVTVDTSPFPYYVYQHGKVMLAFHHGHLSKNESLPLLFASTFYEMWGTTTKRYAHTGHRHHLNEKELNGMKVRQHPTLASPDAYAARGGWMSEREVTSVTYHATHGQVGTNTIVPEMLEAA